MRHHLAAWWHWRTRHRRSSAPERYPSFEVYAGSLREGTRELSYSDIQCQRCNELGGRLRIPRR